jgi:hypothetical protein
MMLPGSCWRLFNLPIGGSILDPPEIPGNIELQTDQPCFRFAAERDDLCHASRGVPFGRNDFEANPDALTQSAGGYQAAAVGIYQGRIATFGKIQPRVEAGQQHRNFKLQPAATP